MTLVVILLGHNSNREICKNTLTKYYWKVLLFHPARPLSRRFPRRKKLKKFKSRLFERPTSGLFSFSEIPFSLGVYTRREVDLGRDPSKVKSCQKELLET